MSKERYIELFKKNITRPGSEELLNWLVEESDFFTAPCSTKYHLCVEGGLCEHSIHVYERMHQMYILEKFNQIRVKTLTPEEEELIAVTALLHDLCKTGYYTVDYKNQKTYDPEKIQSADPRTVKSDVKGSFIWETVPYYTVDDSLPYGHGEKSVMLIERFMRLTEEERMAIRWHMGFSDFSFKGGDATVNNAFSKFPIAVCLYLSDLQATYYTENDNKLFQQPEPNEENAAAA